jgi:hypothetical protein
MRIIILTILALASIDSKSQLHPVYREIDSLPKCDTVKAWMIFADKTYAWYRNRASMMQIIPVNKICDKVFYWYGGNVANDTTIIIIDIINRKP